jgi:diguanylate cyclase (GGDEF)-like protein
MIKNTFILQPITLASMVLFFFLAFSPASYAISPHSPWLQEALDKADKLNDIDPNLALDFTQALLNEPAESLNNLSKAALYSRLAEYNLFLGHLEASQNYIDMFYDLKTDLASNAGVTVLITNAGVLESQGKAKEAMVLYLKAKDNAKAAESNELLADSYGAIAGSLADNLNDAEALEYYHKAYILTKEFGDELEMAYLNIQMSRSYSYIYDDEKAIELANEAIRYFNNNGYYYDELFAQNTLASIYMPMKEYDKAVATYQKMLVLSKQIVTENFADVAYKGLARTYLKKKENDKARHYFNLYKKYTPDSTATFIQIDDLLLSAKIAFADKNTVFVEENIQKAEAILNKLDSQTAISWKIIMLDFKADVAVFKEKFENAYLFQKEARELSKSYQSSEREKIRSKYKVMFDTDQALLKNQLLERDKQLDKIELESSAKQHKLQSLLTVVISLLALGLIFFIYRQRKNSAILHKLANTDTLTELANRRCTFVYAENMLVQAKKNKQNFSIIMFDIDHFKKINDTYGHTCGDIALKDIALVANEYVRNNDILGRIGGEEFLVILPNTSAKQAYEVAERIRHAIEEKDITLSGEVVHISASFGISQLAQNQPNFNQIFNQADIALYQAKNSGRNRISLAS